MSGFFANIILPLLRKYIIQHLVKFFGYLFRKEVRHSEIDHKLEDLKEAGTDPSLTPEQKAKEIEDAFEKLSDAANKRP